MRRASESTPLALYAVGYDPGLANAGVAVVRLAAHPSFDELIELHHWTTEKSDKKRKVLAADDNFRRAQELAAKMRDLHERLDARAGGSVRVITAEAMSFPRNASTAAQMALLWGALAFAVVDRGLPMVQAGPQEIRRRLDLPTKAKKPEVHEKLFRRFTNLRAQLDELRARGPMLTERQWGEACLHPLDALASIVAANDSDVMRMLRASLAA